LWRGCCCCCSLRVCGVHVCSLRNQWTTRCQFALGQLLAAISAVKSQLGNNLRATSRQRRPALGNASGSCSNAGNMRCSALPSSLPLTLLVYAQQFHDDRAPRLACLPSLSWVAPWGAAESAVEEDPPTAYLSRIRHIRQRRRPRQCLRNLAVALTHLTCLAGDGVTAVTAAIRAASSLGTVFYHVTSLWPIVD
jgi:hypothetical protein